MSAGPQKTIPIVAAEEAGAPDALYQDMRAHFSEKDTVNLTVAIATINVWNRLAVGFRSAHPLDAGA